MVDHGFVCFNLTWTYLIGYIAHLYRARFVTYEVEQEDNYEIQDVTVKFIINFPFIHLKYTFIKL